MSFLFTVYWLSSNSGFGVLRVDFIVEHAGSYTLDAIKDTCFTHGAELSKSKFMSGLSVLNHIGEPFLSGVTSLISSGTCFSFLLHPLAFMISPDARAKL